MINTDESQIWEITARLTTSLDIRMERPTDVRVLLDTGSSVLVISEDKASMLIKQGAKIRLGRELSVKDAQQNTFVLNKEVECLVMIQRDDGEIFRMRKYFYIHDTGHDIIINKGTIIDEGLAQFLLGDNIGQLHRNLDKCPEIDEEWLMEEVYLSCMHELLQVGTKTYDLVLQRIDLPYLHYLYIQ